MLAVVDYGQGNVGSVVNLFRKAGARAELSGDPVELRAARALVLPGVGAFDTCMHALRASGLIPFLEERVLGAQVPLLGICVGMQMLTGGSDEGELPGLGWVAGRTRRLGVPVGTELRLPHMGWNRVIPRRPGGLFAGMEDLARFYFVHSYRVECDDPADISGEADYGGPFTAAIERGSLCAVQFHPEKSHRFGQRLAANFLAFAA
ncbi:MAG: imidazole glycerol phosphate synthase subunit HisH [Burkholderiales bacterium]